NEAAVHALGLNDPVGRQVRMPSTGTLFTIAGVVRDFHYSSFQQAVGPLAFSHLNDNLSYRYLSVRLQSANIPQTILSLQNKWKELVPNAPFEYDFMDQRFASLYQSELQLQKAAGLATL